MYKLCILQTHPIQYIVPWFQHLARRPEVDLTVLYCMLPTPEQQGAGFGVSFAWDIPLLEGYRYQVLHNHASRPDNSRFTGCDTPQVYRLVREGGYDACIAGGWLVKSCIQFLWACRQAGIPCIARGESNCLKRRPWWKGPAHRLLLRQYAAFITIGTLNRRFYLDHGVPESKIVDGLNCVDTDRLAAARHALDHDRPGIRRRWGIPGDAYCFLFAGKLIGKKRPQDLLKAFASLQQSTGQAGRQHVLVAGTGSLRAECEAYATAQQLPVTFAGFLNQSEMPRAYTAADCLVLPSDQDETWGMVVNEAMACGLPVIVSDRVGCHPDLVVPGVTGYTFRFADTGELRAAMRAAAAEPDKSRAMGRAAAERAGECSVERLVEDTLTALRRVCRRS